jgi:hypothetical protein
MMKYVIQYVEDGAYESTFGSGWPCSLSEARKFDTRNEAEDHARTLHEHVIVEVDS